MQAILEPELVIAQKCLLVIVFVAEDIFLIFYVDVILNHAHMIRSQFHCVADKLDFAPEDVITHIGQEA